MSSAQTARIPAPLQAAIAIIFCGYVLQCFTPIRLEFDSVRYLQMARSGAEGHGLAGPASSYFPLGYPGMIAGMALVDAANPATLVLLNVAWLGVAAWAWGALFRHSLGFSAAASAGVTAIWLLSWVVIKHSAMPLTECCFTGAAGCALLFMDAGCGAASPRKAGMYAIYAAAFTAMALSFRTAGLALLPPLLWANIVYWRKSGKDRRFRGAAVTAIASMVAGAAVGAWLMRAYSFSIYAAQWKHKPVPVLERLAFRLQELGELALNIPSSALHRFAPGAAIQCAGCALALLAALAIVKRRKFGAAECFALSYAALVVQWPYLDTRFWIPAVPLLAAYVYLAATTATAHVCRLGARTWAAAFVAGGVLSLGYSIWLGTGSTASFAERYGGGSIRNTYCAAFGGCAIDPSRQPADPEAVEVLRFFR